MANSVFYTAGGGEVTEDDVTRQKRLDALRTRINEGLAHEIARGRSSAGAGFTYARCGAGY